MKKKLYYAVKMQLNDIDGVMEGNGYKTITLYTIENNEPKEWFELDVLTTLSTIEEIKDWLIDNGYGDECDQIEMIEL